MQLVRFGRCDYQAIALFWSFKVLSTIAVHNGRVRLKAWGTTTTPSFSASCCTAGAVDVIVVVVDDDDEEAAPIIIGSEWNNYGVLVWGWAECVTHISRRLFNERKWKGSNRRLSFDHWQGPSTILSACPFLFPCQDTVFAAPDLIALRTHFVSL